MRKVAFVSAMMTNSFFAIFGWTWFYLSAMMGLFTILNYVFSVTLRIIGLWKERGFGWWLLGGLWAAAYNLLLLPTTVVNNIMVFNRAQAKQALPTSTNGSAPGKTDDEILPLQRGTGSNPDGARTPDEVAAASSPYSSAARQLVQAREMLALQRREAAETLDNVHGYYERRMQAPPSSGTALCPGPLILPRSGTTLNCQAAEYRAST
jgi:hypothetical protein